MLSTGALPSCGTTSQVGGPGQFEVPITKNTADQEASEIFVEAW